MTPSASRVTDALGIVHPIIQAPMAGGTTTPALVAAVAEAGGLGSIGAGYLSPAAVTEAIAETRARTARPFAVNLFIPQPFTADAARIDRANGHLDAFRAELGLSRPDTPARYAPDFEDQFEAVIEAGVPVFSFTFGALDAARIQRLQAAGTCVVGTATTVVEARHLEATGVDMIVAQGAEAGGHRGTFLGDAADGLVGTMALVPQVVDAVSIPVIASGGIMDGRGMAAARILGAEAVQMGSAFLACDESGAKPAHKQAVLVAGDTPTAVTRAFSGKPARGLRNRFIDTLGPFEHELPDYPVQNAWTKDIRATAGARDRPEFMSLWAGQAAGMARAEGAGALVARLAADLEAHWTQR